VQTGTRRRVTFVTKSPTIHVRPAVSDVDPGFSDAPTVLLPAALGTSEIEVSTPGYKTAKYSVAVTAGTVIVLWAIGGVLGSLCAFYKLRGSIVWRVLVGMIAAGVLTWAYVYGALPAIDATIAHNLLSVLFVSILGGYLGIAVLDSIAKRMNFT
jgi:hypothetical protein